MAVDLDIHSIMDKFARQRRGGYCYEHNALFQYILQDMGFTVTGLAARVLMNAPGDVITRLSHMLLLVEVQGEPFIADTGFGALPLNPPIRLVADLFQAPPPGPHPLLHRGNNFL